MGNLCGTDDIKDATSSYEALSNLKQSSFKMSTDMRNDLNNTFSDDSLLSLNDFEIKDEERLNNYYSVIISKNSEETNHSPPESMRQKIMNKKGVFGIEKLKELLEKYQLSDEIEKWKVVNNGENPLFGPIFYDDGSTYKGQFLRGQKSGYGELVFTDGSFYLGNWKNDQKHGNGIFVFNDGDIILGSFRSDKLTGEGI